MGVFEETPSKTSQSGFRIYKLIKDGPLDKGGLKELTDFILPPQEILEQKNTFHEWIQSLADQTVKIKVYSLLTRNFKTVEIKTNPKESKEGILGAGVKFENYENADKKLLHVVSVVENSFAQNKLGLIPNDDYIIAVKGNNTPIISLNINEYNPLEVLNMVINNNRGNNLTFYIYNVKSGPRFVEVNIEKENDFVLGCDVAYGALHDFPKIQDDIIEEMDKEKEVGNASIETTNSNSERIEEKKDNNNQNKENMMEGNVSVENKKEEESNVIEEDII
jgi:hypothetical protein